MSQPRAGRQVVLCRHPDGPIRPDDFEIIQSEPVLPPEGGFLVRTLFVSVDPMLRLFIDPKPLGGLMPPMPLGTPIPGAAVGEVIESGNPAFAVGDLVEGRFGWQDYAISDGAGVNRVSPALGGAENALGIAGLPGFTAYVGLEAAGGVKPGQTYLVSGAAGAVGSVAGALIRSRGGRAVGIAGGADKRRYLIDRIGYDAAVDRLAPDFAERLADGLPKGADVYFDNVGGPLLAIVVPRMARGGLVLISGLMAQYQGDPETGIDNLPPVLRAVMMNGVRIQGFTQAGQAALRPAFEAEMTGLLARGEIDAGLHIVDGLEKLPEAMCGLFERSVAGKVVVRVNHQN